jgi:hypothetical protein
MSAAQNRASDEATDALEVLSLIVACAHHVRTDLRDAARRHGAMWWVSGSALEKGFPDRAHDRLSDTRSLHAAGDDVQWAMAAS